MAASISGTTKERKRGRPVTTGAGTSINVRVSTDDLTALDAWIAAHPDTPTRPEAIRRLMREALSSSID